MVSPSQSRGIVVSRRRFIASLSVVVTGAVMQPGFEALAAPNAIELGVCRSFEQHATIKQAGFQYIEEGVGHALMPNSTDAEFEKRLAEIKGASIPVRACNGFIPAEMKLVGPSVDMPSLVRFVQVTMQRAEKVGIKVIVLGSGGARKIPEGFDRTRAREQFVEFGRRIAPIAHDHGVTVVLEALNRGETNFINRVDEGMTIVDDIGNPGFQMHADVYHMMREDEGPESIIRAGAKLKHCHVAEKKTRTAPGVDGDDFRPYFKALKTIGYQGRISIECGWKKFELELPNAHRALEQQLQSV